MPVNPARVREARLDAGLSLAELAGNDVSRTFIHFIEHGRSRPSKAVLTMIARRTGKPISYFLEQSDVAVEPADDVAAELLRLAVRIGRLSTPRNTSDRQILKLIQLTLRQAAELIRRMALQPHITGARDRQLNSGSE
jgi:transcriptional regulator with XRE-family HTH domain